MVSNRTNTSANAKSPKSDLKLINPFRHNHSPVTVVIVFKRTLASTTATSVRESDLGGRDTLRERYRAATQPPRTTTSSKIAKFSTRKTNKAPAHEAFCSQLTIRSGMFTNIILDQMYLKSDEAAQRLKPAARQAFTGPVQMLPWRLGRFVGLRGDYFTYSFTVFDTACPAHSPSNNCLLEPQLKFTKK